MTNLATWRRLLWRAFLATLAALALAEVLALAWLHGLASDADFRTYASITELRARYGAFERFQAHRHLGFCLAPGYRRGANRHNALGFRGDEIAAAKPPGTVRIACAGGSTTYGEGVEDYRQAVPALLESKLRADGHATEVVNAGCPGWTTLETLLNFETRLLDLGVDHLVVYHGINDVFPRMVWPQTAYRGDLAGWLCRAEHLAEASLLDRSALARIVRIRLGRLAPHSDMLRIVGDVPSTSFSFAFRAQRNANVYPDGIFREVPVEQMLAANPPRFFERNLRSLLAVGASHGVSVVLSTFAYSAEFPHRPFIGHPAVRAAIDATNDIVRALGRETGTPVVDLQPALQRREFFTDGVHFTLAGNEERAAILHRFFAERLR
ncbi:MAG: SGNH/GDSL hydrolase family protein [Planctomycetota bacterium]